MGTFRYNLDPILNYLLNPIAYPLSLILFLDPMGLCLCKELEFNQLKTFSEPL